jgi:hypothetical protein
MPPDHPFMTTAALVLGLAISAIATAAGSSGIAIAALAAAGVLAATELGVWIGGKLSESWERRRQEDDAVAEQILSESRAANLGQAPDVGEGGYAEKLKHWREALLEEEQAAAARRQGR